MKPYYILLIFLATSACTLNDKQEKLSIANLKKCFLTKDEVRFLNQFPKDMDKFKAYFGWDYEKDQPQELYTEAYHYIDYWFSLLKSNKEHEIDIINICKNGFWEADAINYFQDKALSYIKNENRYELINELNGDDAKKVLFFLFDGPHPKYDDEFASNLSPVKLGMLTKLFEVGLYDHNENPDPPTDELVKYNYMFSNFTENEHFFIRDIDANNDGVPDKIVSAGQYQGDELLIFINSQSEYQFALKTTNFSEDGGNQIIDIVAAEDGFYIKTAFLDGGLNEAYHHIAFIDHDWVVTNTVYKTKSSNQEGAFIYVCDVTQGLHLEDPLLVDKLKGIPDESDRNRICTKETI